MTENTQYSTQKLTNPDKILLKNSKFIKQILKYFNIFSNFQDFY